MSTTEFISLLPYFISVLIAGTVAFASWRRRLLPGAGTFTVMVIAELLWTTGYIFELTAQTLPRKIFWDNLQFVPTFAVSICLIYFAGQYTGLFQIPRRIWIALLAVPFSALLLLVADPYLNLVRVQSTLDGSTPFVYLKYDFGPAMWGMFIYFYGLIFAGLLILLRHFLEHYGFYRWQTGLIFIGFLIPFVGNLLFLIVPEVPRDVTPITFALSNLFIYWALFHFRLFDMVPVAYQAVVDSMPDLVLVLDVKQRVIAINPAVERLLQVRRKDMIGQRADAAFANLPVDIWRSPDRSGPIEVEVPDRELVRYLEVNHMPLQNEKIRIAGRLIVMRDVTERRRYRLALEDSEARHRTIVNSALLGTLVLQDTRVCFVNPALSTILGYTRDEFLSMTLRDVLYLMHPPHRRSLLRTYGKKLPVAARHEVQAMRKDGSNCWLELFLARIDYQGRPAISVSFVDITERKSAEDALRRSEEQNRALLAAMPDIMLLVDRNGTIVDYHLPEPDGQFVDVPRPGQAVDTFLPMSLANQIEFKLSQVFCTGAMQRLSYELPRNGERRFFEARFASCGEELVLAVVHDMTEQRVADQRRVALAVEQEKVNVLTSFIQYAAHEFRNPLAVIGTNAYLLNRLEDPSRRQQKYEQIQHSVDDLAGLLDTMMEMLDVEYASPPDRAEIDVNRAVSAALSDVRAAAAARSLQLVAELAHELPPVAGDVDLLTRVFVHILRNAIHFTPVGGTVTVRSYSYGARAFITISDTGIGIAKEEQGDIFKRFYRVDKAHTSRGLGLGLNIAQKIVFLHGGEIEVASEPEVGSTFTVSLPLLAIPEMA